MQRLPRPWVTGVALIATGLLGVSLGGSEASQATRLNNTAIAGMGPHERALQAKERRPLALNITPASDAKNLPITTEIGVNVAHGKINSVMLTEQGGGPVTGAMRPDSTSWMPDKPLKLGKTYTAQVTASGAHGQKLTQTANFTTMAAANHRVTASLYMRDGATYGVAMPVVIEFDEDIPKEARSGIERRIFVTSDPPQEGAWRWFADRQLLYRPAQHWKPGTKLTVRAALDGQPVGKNRFGDKDSSATATVGRDMQLQVDNKTKQLSVYQSGKLVKTMPVSLGKASTPSSSGTMVIMEQAQNTIFDTFAELGPSEGYRVAVQYAQRLTWGGQFIHSAPWSIWAQGRQNVSHGCVNLSPANAKWLFDVTKVGDPITVRNTEHKLDPGDGWTAWNMSWEDYLKDASQ